jgi:2-phosphosulfolactate phosphatase
LIFAAGAREILLVANPQEALALKSKDPDLILVGEVGGAPIPGFDLGNSPSRILGLGDDFFRERRVVQRTSAGVQGVLAALQGAQEVLLGSYGLARATAGYIRERGSARVSIVAMGQQMKSVAPEDEWCARYLAHLLGRGPYDHREALREILFSETTRKFLRGDKAHYPPEDPALCLQRDLFDFVLKAERHARRVVVRRADGAECAGASPPTLA